MTKPQFLMSADTRSLHRYLAKIAVGDIASYAEMSRDLGFKVHGGLPALQSARRALLRDDVVFDAVRGVGIKRLSEVEILKSTDSEIRAIRNKARKGTRKLAAIDNFEDLSSRDQITYLTKTAAFAVIEEVGSEKGIQKIEKASSGRASQLSIRQSLEAFISK